MTSSKAFLAAATAWVLLLTPASGADTRTCVLIVIAKNGKPVRLNTELAVSEAEKQRGLMYRKQP